METSTVTAGWCSQGHNCQSWGGTGNLLQALMLGSTSALWSHPSQVCIGPTCVDGVGQVLNNLLVLHLETTDVDLNLMMFNKARPAFHPSVPQPVLIPGIALTQVEDPACGLVELHEDHMGPFLDLLQVPQAWYHLQIN